MPARPTHDQRRQPPGIDRQRLPGHREPQVSDYLSDAEMDRLAELLIGLLVATRRSYEEAAS